MSDKELETKSELNTNTNETKKEEQSKVETQPVQVEQPKQEAQPVKVEQPKQEAQPVQSPQSTQPEQPKQEAQPEIRIELGGGKKLNNEFAHNTPQDVNANVGSFSADIKDPSKEEPKQDELIVADKSKKFENIKGKDVEIDFEKFSKRKLAKQKKQREYKPGKSKFSVTLDT